MTTYKINEIFTSIQGEGKFVGYPVIFLRLAGCSMGCSFCDTKYCQQVNQQMTAKEIINYFADKFPFFSRVVITGGEPFEQDLSDLLFLLDKNEYAIHIETNCAHDIPKEYANVIWLTGSPKKRWEDKTVKYCDEIKVVVSTDKDINKALHLHDVNRQALLYLQPESNKPENIKKCVEACLKWPHIFHLSVQVHKMIEVR